MSEDERRSDGLREEIDAWISANWDPGLTVEEWWRRMAKDGWTAPHLPVDHGGRGLHPQTINLIRSRCSAAGALRPPGGLGMLMAAPTILAQGTAEQIDRLVPPILDGSAGWCQLFSEPGSGSDLAGLTTRAERDGDRWIINGQKVWSSMAMESDYGMLLARTDFSAVKHAGISWFAFPLDQSGVTIRPLREMTGDAVFNEVFLDDAIVDDANLIGGEGNGWKVTQTTLFFERTGIGGGTHTNWPDAGPKGGFVGRRAGDAALDPVPVNDMIVRYPELVDLARACGRANDPLVRQELARLLSYVRVSAWNAERSKSEAAAGGPANAATTGKLASTRVAKLAAELGAEILGPQATLAGDDGFEGGRFSKAMVFSPASAIYGGTDEIQRNIIGERSLGLPRDDQPGKGLPYEEVLQMIRQLPRPAGNGSG